MINKIQRVLDSMGHRKLLFIVGDHLVGKTALVKTYLQEVYGEEGDNRYVDVGLFIQKKIPKENLRKYKLFPEEFKADVEILFKELIEECYLGKELLVLDHMEFLLSEKYTGWISLLDKLTIKDKKAIIIVPSEYEGSLPLKAYRYLKIQ